MQYVAAFLNCACCSLVEDKSSLRHRSSSRSSSSGNMIIAYIAVLLINIIYTNKYRRFRYVCVITTYLGNIVLRVIMEPKLSWPANAMSHGSFALFVHSPLHIIPGSELSTYLFGKHDLLMTKC